MEKKDICSRSFDFAVRIVRLCKELDSQAGVSRTLASQLLRSGTSIGANIEEAQAGQSRADFIAKLSISCKEARETHYWLKLLAEAGLVKRDRLLALSQESSELIAILTTIIKNSKEKNKI